MVGAVVRTWEGGLLLLSRLLLLLLLPPLAVGVPNEPVTLSAGAVFFIGVAFARWLRSKGHSAPKVSVSEGRRQRGEGGVTVCARPSPIGPKSQGIVARGEEASAVRAHATCLPAANNTRRHLPACCPVPILCVFNNNKRNICVCVCVSVCVCVPAPPQPTRRRPRPQVGRDPRLSGPLLESAFAAGLIHVSPGAQPAVRLWP